MIKAANKVAVQEAATVLQSDGLVAIPTETVYGLAANALNENAVSKIFKLKNRPEINPLIVHFNSLDDACVHAFISEQARMLGQAFWPGPLTIIVNRKENCPFPNNVTAGLPTIAVRVPSHPTARAIIKAANCPLAAPSANRSGEPSPTNAMDVATSLGDDDLLIIADGSSKIGLESTVVDMSGEKAVILRPGAITAEEISDVLGYEVVYDHDHDESKPKSPGQLLKHYAPKAKVRLRAVDVKDGEALLAFGSTKFMNKDDVPDRLFLNLSETGDLEEAAHHLYHYIRKLDQTGVATIAVMDIPKTGLGYAINERLERAAKN